MPVCPSCGKQFSGFSFGANLATKCRECRNQDPQQIVNPAPQMEASKSYETFLRAGHSPVVTRTIIVLNVLVFLAMGFSGASWTDPSVSDALRWGANYGVLTLSGQWWRLLTSMFVHFGFVHIALNMWCLWSLGPILERLIGSKGFAMLYLCCGLAASEVTLAWNPVRAPAGASGAIFGIAGAFFSFLYFKKAPIDLQFMRRKLKSLVAFIFYNLFFGAVYFRVDNAAHVGGLVAGLILGASVPGAVGKFPIEPGPHQEQLLDAGDAPYDDPLSKETASRRLILIGLISALVLVGAAFAIQKHYVAVAEFGAAANFIRAGQPAKAIVELESAVALNPKQSFPYEMLGILLLERYDPTNAYHVLEMAVERDPNDGYFRHNLALAYVGAGYPKDARREIGWALQSKFEDQSSAQFILGLCSYMDHDYQDASTQLILAIKGRDDFFEAQEVLARVYIEMGKWDEARILYKSVLSRHSDDPIAKYGLSFLGLAPGDRLNLNEMALFEIPYSKLTAKSPLWPYYP